MRNDEFFKIVKKASEKGITVIDCINMSDELFVTFTNMSLIYLYEFRRNIDLTNFAIADELYNLKMAELYPETRSNSFSEYKKLKKQY